MHGVGRSSLYLMPFLHRPPKALAFLTLALAETMDFTFFFNSITQSLFETWEGNLGKGVEAEKEDRELLIFHKSCKNETSHPSGNHNSKPLKSGTAEQKENKFPTAQKYLRLANHLLLPHHVSRDGCRAQRTAAARPAPACPPRRRRRASSGCASLAPGPEASPPLPPEVLGLPGPNLV